jgi:dipeptidyl aminopeptidase/acylaminoacyl peptidase
MSSVSASFSPERIRAVLATPSTVLADVDLDPASPERILVRGDASGSMQLYELCDGAMTELTALDEPVGSAHYVPGTRRAVLAVDQGGDERHQLYLLDLDAAAQATASSLARLRPLTEDPRYAHHFSGVSPDGSVIAYVSNRRNGVDFDLWTCRLPDGEHACRYAPGAWLQPGSGFSPDGRYVSVLRPGEWPLDNDLVLLDIETGEAKTVLAHPGEPALIGPPAWIPGGFFASSNAGRDFAAIVRHDLATGGTSSLPGTGEAHDAEVLASRHGPRLAVIENRNGASALQLIDPADGTPGIAVALPETGVVSSHQIAPPIFSVDGGRLYYTWSTPRSGPGVLAYDVRAGTSRKLTSTPGGVAADELIGAERGQVESFDGERVPVFIFRPRGVESRPPVVIVVHGGPESQSTLAFNPVIQALARSGFGVVVPNVRGSTGYGRRYAALDDTTKRLDSVRDLAAVHGSLGASGFDPERAALWGASYGGYMVLAGLAFQPELWAAGVDIVGISNLVTFLQSTSAYRRAHREREYGSLERDQEFLRSASPLLHADRMTAPLFIIHGRNDPRVPLSEAEQLIKSLSARAVRCTLRVYDDEGHGLARLANRLDAYPRAIGFLHEILRV